MATELIAFHGFDLEATCESGVPYANLRRMCECLGLDYASQYTKVKRADWATVVMIATVAEDGKDRPMVFLSADSIPMWLTTIRVAKVAEECRSVLRVFQKEAAAVLYRHFCGDPAVTVNDKVLDRLTDVVEGVKVCADGIRACLANQGEIKREVSEVKSEVQDLAVRVDRLEQRRPLAVRTKREHVEAIAHFYSGRCPCCMERDVLGPKAKVLPDANFDHWMGKSKNKAHQTWLVCRDCNLRLENDESFKRSQQPSFDSYQLKREKKSLPLLGGAS